MWDSLLFCDGYRFHDVFFCIMNVFDWCMCDVGTFVGTLEFIQPR